MSVAIATAYFVEGDRPNDALLFPFLAVGALGLIIAALTSEPVLRFADRNFRATAKMEIREPSVTTWKSGYGDLDYDMKVAGLRVRNARETGGSRRTAKEVKAKVEIWDAGEEELLYEHVGWDEVDERDFRPNHEEHVLWVASTAVPANFAIGAYHKMCVIVPEGRSETGERIVGDPTVWSTDPADSVRLEPGKYVVVASLRGDNLTRVHSEKYDLQIEGKDGGLMLTPRKKAHWWTRS